MTIAMLLANTAQAARARLDARCFERLNPPTQTIDGKADPSWIHHDFAWVNSSPDRGLALLVFLFFDWFGGGAEVTGSIVNGTATLSHPGISGWDALTDLPGFLIILSGVAGIALAYLAAAGQRVNVPVRRGATTALLGTLAVLLILWWMFAGSPTLKIGIFLGLGAAIAITAGALMALVRTDSSRSWRLPVAVRGPLRRRLRRPRRRRLPRRPRLRAPRSSGGSTTTRKSTTTKKPAAKKPAAKKSSSSRSSTARKKGSTGTRKRSSGGQVAHTRPPPASGIYRVPVPRAAGVAAAKS